MSHKVIYGLYNDDDILSAGARVIVAKGIRINTTYSPFPIHGIEDIIGMKWTRLAITAFIYGCIGLVLGLVGMNYFLITDWPMNIGGKPNFNLLTNLPSLIPIAFEFTVLCAAHGMAITYLLRNWTLPGVKARNPDPRTTDDHFAIEISTYQNANHTEEEINALLKETGAVEVFDKKN